MAPAYINDVGIITSGPSAEEDVATLRQLHNRAEIRAGRHASVFDQKKYHLVHFTRTANDPPQDALILPNHTVERELDYVYLVDYVYLEVLRLVLAVVVWHACLC